MAYCFNKEIKDKIYDLVYEILTKIYFPDKKLLVANNTFCVDLYDEFEGDTSKYLFAINFGFEEEPERLICINFIFDKKDIDLKDSLNETLFEYKSLSKGLIYCKWKSKGKEVIDNI